jgi:hypothetical protein
MQYLSLQTMTTTRTDMLVVIAGGIRLVWYAKEGRLDV